MKKLLLFIDSLNSGGAQRQLVGLAVLLRQRGYKVMVLTYYALDFYKSELLDAEIECECVNTGRNFVTRVLKVNNAIRRFKPDTVISYLDTPNKIACALKHLTFAKWKLIVSERNTTQSLSRSEKTKFRLFRFANIIVPNSISQARFIARNYPGYTDKLAAITNFVDTEYFSPNPSRASHSETRQIICVGRIAPQKNLIAFLNAVSKVKNNGSKFRIYWYGQKVLESYYNECEQLINDLGISDVFEFHEPDNSIRDRYREVDVFCLPSLYEGFPNVLCEAMSCGLPVLCSNVCDNPNIAEDGKSGYLFNPKAVDEIASSMIAMLDLSDEQLDKMGSFNRELAIDLFSKSEFVNKYIAIINS